MLPSGFFKHGNGKPLKWSEKWVHGKFHGNDHCKWWMFRCHVWFQLGNRGVDWEAGGVLYSAWCFLVRNREELDLEADLVHSLASLAELDEIDLNSLSFGSSTVQSQTSSTWLPPPAWLSAETFCSWGASFHGWTGGIQSVCCWQYHRGPSWSAGWRQGGSARNAWTCWMSNHHRSWKTVFTSNAYCRNVNYR